MSEKLDYYYSNPAISQSQLKTLVYGPEIFKNDLEKGLDSEMFFEEKLNFNLGRAVDTLITGLEEDEFNQEFYVSSLETKPSDIIKSIIQEVYSLVSTQEVIEGLNNYRNLILNSCDNHSYYMNWKEDTRINKIIESGSSYFNELVSSKGRTILSQEEYQKVLEIVKSIKYSDFTKDYFVEDFDKEILYQLPIYFKLRDVNCKALLDMVIINHKDKTIQIIDIKTMGDRTSKFPTSMIRHKYYIQAAMYTEAMKYYITQIQPLLKDYKLRPFKFIVESTIEVGYPRVFTMSPELVKLSYLGRSSIFVNYYRKDDPPSVVNRMLIRQEVYGLYELLDLYVYYMNTNFEKEKNYIDNKGHFVVSYEGIIH